MISSPSDTDITANRLRLHLLEWGSGDSVVLLLHGFLEHAHVWDFVAPRLAAGGHHVYALDWRGHGDSQWIGAGGYYHYFDYVADLAALIPQLGAPAALVAHSMGGGAALLYAGAQPNKVRALVAIEGLGAPDMQASFMPERVSGWLDDLRKLEQRQRPDVQLDAAVSRMCERWPTLPPAMARHLIVHGTRQSDTGRQWKFDPLHQTRAPLPTPPEYARQLWQRIACPVLYVDGERSGLRPAYADLDARLAVLRARRVSLAAAGHHPHLEQPEALSELLLQFLANP